MIFEENSLNNGVIKASVGLLAFALFIYLGVLTANAVKEGRYIGRPDTQRDSITINGEGRVTAVPDIGKISIGLVIEDKDVSVAQRKNIEQFNKVMESLKDEGVEKEDLRTSNYSVSPRYDYTDKGQILKGYEVVQSVEVKIRDLEKAGAIIASASQNGVNQVSGLEFTIDDPEEFRQQAREQALKNADQKAKRLAELAGVKLGKIISFSESVSGGVIQPYYLSSKMAAESSDRVEPQFEAGSEEIIVNATIEYEIY